jgi:hypothetical protein
VRTSAALYIAALAALSACTQQVTMPVAQAPVTSIVEYFWKSASPSMTLTDTFSHPLDDLSFHDVPGGLNVDDGSVTKLSCVVNDDSVYAGGFNTGSVIDLDYGSYFSGLDTEVAVAHKVNAIHLTDGTSNNPPIVATDTGVFVYDQPNHRYVLDGLGGRDVRSIVYDYHNYTAYVIDASDTIWYRQQVGANVTWKKLSLLNLPRGHILALAADTTLFAAIEGTKEIYMFARDRSGWNKIPPLFAGRQVTALGVHVYSKISEIIAGTIDGYIGLFSEMGATLNPETLMSSAAGRIYSFFRTSSVEYAGTDAGLYTDSNGLTPAWHYFTSTAATAPITKVDYFVGGVTFLANGKVYSFEPTSSIANNLSFVGKATDLTVGIRIFATDGAKLSSRGHSSGPWVDQADWPRYYNPHVPGGLVLLRRNLLSVSSSWRAGTLVVHEATSYAITGRVLQRLDALQISGKKYADVFVIRYAHELPSGEAESGAVPFWVVYYQRGVGPIMFDKVRTTSGVQQVSRRQIQSP